MLDIMRSESRAKVFWSGRSQAVRLPKAFRFSGESVAIRRDGKRVILEPIDDWPEGWFEWLASAPLGKTFEVPKRSRKITTRKS